MALIPFQDFAGVFPRIPAHKLPDTAAQYALDCDFLTGSLTGVKTDAATGLSSPSQIKSIYVHDSAVIGWYAWDRDVDAVRGPIVDDAYSRFYWTDGSEMYVSRGDVGGQGNEPSATNKYKVGVPTPTSAMTAPVSAFLLPGIASVPVPNLGIIPLVSAQQICTNTSDGTTIPGDMLGVTWSEITKSSMKVTLSGFTACVAPAVEPTYRVVPASWDGETWIPESVEELPGVQATYQAVVKLTFIRWDGGTTVTTVRPTDDGSGITFDGVKTQVDWGDTVAITFSQDQTAVESRAYTYTYVNQYGEEGAPAEPFVYDAINGQAVTLSYAAPPSGYVPISKIRVYRTATGAQSTAYLYVGEVVVNATSPSFEDKVLTENLGEPISTLGYLPPESGLKGLCNIGNGMLAAFKGNEVHISQPYLPYAWKSSNIQTMPNSVVGLAPFESGVYVTTTAHPVVITGVDPDSMSNQKIPAIQAGVSKGSICNIGPYIAYASHDGIVTIRGLDASLDYSLKFFTRDVWRSLYGNKLSRMRMNAHDGNLLVWFDDGTAPFLIRLEEESPSMTNLSQPVYAAHVHPVSDALYVATGSSLLEFKGGSSRKGFTWWSKDFVLPKANNFGNVMLVGTGDVRVEAYADGTLKHSKSLTLSLTDANVYTLPSGFKSRRWSFKVVGSVGAVVKEMYVANTVSELQNV